MEVVLNHYMSRKFDRIPALRNAVKNQDTFDIMDSEEVKKLKKALKDSFVKNQHHIHLANPEFKAIFSAARSTRKKIDSNDLNLPPPTNRETQLAEQGYKASYTAGIDKMNEWGAVRRRLQELNVNPRTTHIEYFADQIPDHIAHIRKGLEESYFPRSTSDGSKLDQLQKLNNLEEEAKKAVSAGKVTYKWWLKFNGKLADLMSRKEDIMDEIKILNPKLRKDEIDDLVEQENKRITQDIQSTIENSVSQFPLKIIMPTTTEDIGIMTFNKAGIEGIYPTGLTNKQMVEVDGSKYNPVRFFQHDLEHSTLSGNMHFSRYSAGHRLFHRRVLRNMEKLPPDKRKKSEAVYFTMTHESGTSNLSDIELEDYDLGIVNISTEKMKKN